VHSMVCGVNRPGRPRPLQAGRQAFQAAPTHKRGSQPQLFNRGGEHGRGGGGASLTDGDPLHLNVGRLYTALAQKLGDPSRR
jgi:hypothetical protein